jgi:hypothetical protein
MTKRIRRDKLRDIYQGRWEQFMDKTVGPEHAMSVSRAVEAFLSCWPSRYTPQEFLPTDLGEFREYLLMQGKTEATVIRYCDTVKGFWRFLQDYCDEPVIPFLPLKRAAYKRQKKGLLVSELRRLLTVMDPRVRRYVCGYILGQTVDVGLGHARRAGLFIEAANAAGLPELRMRDLKPLLREGLWSALLTVVLRAAPSDSELISWLDQPAQTPEPAPDPATRPNPDQEYKGLYLLPEHAHSFCDNTTQEEYQTEAFGLPRIIPSGYIELLTPLDDSPPSDTNSPEASITANGVGIDSKEPPESEAGSGPSSVD